MISSCLTRERVKGYVEDVITKTDIFVEKLRQSEDGRADFARLITTLTVEVFVKAVYNYEMNLFEKPDDKLFKAIEDSLVLSKELPYEEFPALWFIFLLYIIYNDRWITHPFLMNRFTRGKNYVNAYLDKLIEQYRDPK
jgi:cytochrome P450